MVVLHPLETELIATLNSSLLNMNQKYKITTTKTQADLQQSISCYILHKVSLKSVCYLLPQLGSIGVNLEQAGHEIQTQSRYDREKSIDLHFNLHVLGKCMVYTRFRAIRTTLPFHRSKFTPKRACWEVLPHR